MPWGQVKKRVLASLAESVRGRVTIGVTSYRTAHDYLGRARIGIDGREILIPSFAPWECSTRDPASGG